jgi:hypothetical protein
MPANAANNTGIGNAVIVVVMCPDLPRLDQAEKFHLSRCVTLALPVRTQHDDHRMRALSRTATVAVAPTGIPSICEDEFFAA